MNFRASTRRTAARSITHPLLLVILTSSLCLSGCQFGIEGEYGRRVGDSRGTSVNGTSVLASLFEQSGAKVRTARRLGRVVDQADVVVWFPNNYEGPSQAVREHFEKWLQAKDGRTLIYVGRDYDALVEYWKTLLAEAPPEQQMELRRRIARAETAFAQGRAKLEDNADYDWFAVERGKPAQTIDSLAGPLSPGIDAGKSDLRLNTRIMAGEIVRQVAAEADWRGPARLERLLTSRDDLLIGRFTRGIWNGSQVIIVANGAALLNLPLVNHEHRKLAARLVGECGPAKSVVFLESGPGEPPISNSDPNQHHGLAAFTVWPLNSILLHLTLLGAILCFSMYPIFGRPRMLNEEAISDFGKHIRALGGLLAATHDRQYAQERRADYQQRVNPESTAATESASVTDPIIAGGPPGEAGSTSQSEHQA